MTGEKASYGWEALWKVGQHCAGLGGIASPGLEATHIHGLPRETQLGHALDVVGFIVPYMLVPTTWCDLGLHKLHGTQV